MHRPSRSIVTLVLFLGAVLPAVAQQPVPAILVRVRSLDALQVQGATFFDQLGLGKTFGDLDARLKTKAGPKGLAGIDTSKPIGAFVHFDPDPAWALLVPVAGEAAFLDLLDRLDYKTTLGKDGVRTFAVNPIVEGAVKFDRGYAWITVLNRNWLASARRSMRRRCSRRGGPLVSGRVRLDLVPKDAKQLLTAEFEERMQESLKTALKSDKAGGSDVTTALFQELPRLFAQLVNEGKELAAEHDFAPVAKELRMQVRLDPLPGTALAKSLAEMGQRKNSYPAAGDAALTANVGVPAADADRQGAHEARRRQLPERPGELHRCESQGEVPGPARCPAAHARGGKPRGAAAIRRSERGSEARSGPVRRGEGRRQARLDDARDA